MAVSRGAIALSGPILFLFLKKTTQQTYCGRGNVAPKQNIKEEENE